MVDEAVRVDVLLLMDEKKRSDVEVRWAALLTCSRGVSLQSRSRLSNFVHGPTKTFGAQSRSVIPSGQRLPHQYISCACPLNFNIVSLSSSQHNQQHPSVFITHINQTHPPLQTNSKTHIKPSKWHQRQHPRSVFHAFVASHLTN